MAFVAKKIFLTKGVGKHRERLSSFELALRSAGIAACNIVRVSSIFPPNCKLISDLKDFPHKGRWKTSGAAFELRACSAQRGNRGVQYRARLFYFPSELQTDFRSKRFSSQRALENIGSGFRASSLLCAARESRRAISCASLLFSLRTAN